MKTSGYQIRAISQAELEIPISWAVREGWNPGLYDAEAFYAADPQGFLMGFLDEEPISSISAVAYDNIFGFLGFYIVKPEYRGRGYGYRLWEESLKHLPTQNVGLDGVVDQQANYKKSGFKLAYRNIRYEGIGSEKQEASRSDIVSLSEISFSQLLAYDSQIFPTQRAPFLKKWIRQPESLAIGFIEDKQLRGYGMVRKCQTGYKVGPLFADGKFEAITLFEHLRSFVGNNPIFLDVPEINEDAVEMAKEGYQMEPMFETARMYTKRAPKVPMEKVFGVTTFELG